MKRIGILGGSFDPVHFGHLNLGLSLAEACALDEVWCVPAALSPFKEHAPSAVSPAHRLAMLNRAIASIPGWRALDWELKAQGPSFSIDTIRALAQDTALQLHLLIGEDHLATFHLWKEAEALSRLATLLVGSRSSHSPDLASTRFEARRIKIPLLDISSTTVRERLLQKKYCGHLVPAPVLDYIAQHQLYTL